MKNSNPEEDSEGLPGPDAEVEVFHRVNKLKLKAGAGLHEGPGFIDSRSVQRAQTKVEGHEAVYNREMIDIMAGIDEIWARNLKEHNDDVREELYHKANHIKDLASVFGFTLMQYFGQSLRDFTAKMDVSKPEHQIIVKAHIDVMKIVFQEKIKHSGGEKAEELKKIVIKAIEKYS